MAKLTLVSKRDILKTRKRAADLVGGLSNTSKMPKHNTLGENLSTGSSYSTSAYDCRTGSKLRKVEGSVCSFCYATRGRQGCTNVQNAYRRRSDAYRTLGAESWTDAMVDAIDPCVDFRFFDSGDIADYRQACAIVDIAERRPDSKFWVPTKEYADVAKLRQSRVLPDNLCIRVSAPMLNADAPNYGVRSVVFTADKANEVPENAHICPCSTGDRKTCDGTDEQTPCRACWDNGVEVVCYLKH